MTGSQPTQTILQGILIISRGSGGGWLNRGQVLARRLVDRQQLGPVNSRLSGCIIFELTFNSKKLNMN